MSDTGPGVQAVSVAVRGGLGGRRPGAKCRRHKHKRGGRRPVRATFPLVHCVTSGQRMDLTMRELCGMQSWVFEMGPEVLLRDEWPFRADGRYYSPQFLHFDLQWRFVAQADSEGKQHLMVQV